MAHKDRTHSFHFVINPPRNDDAFVYIQHRYTISSRFKWRKKKIDSLDKSKMPVCLCFFAEKLSKYLSIDDVRHTISMTSTLTAQTPWKLFSFYSHLVCYKWNRCESIPINLKFKFQSQSFFYRRWIRARSVLLRCDE